MSRGRHARSSRFGLRSLWRRSGGRRRAPSQAPDADVLALRERLAAVEAYARQITEEFAQVRQQLAVQSAAPNAASLPGPLDPGWVAPVEAQPAYQPSLQQPSDSALWQVMPEPEYPQIVLPDTPTVWAGASTASPQPAETAADDGRPALHLDIPLVAQLHLEPEHAQFGDQAIPTSAAPLIDVVPTVTRRAG